MDYEKHESVHKLSLIVYKDMRSSIAISSLNFPSASIFSI